MAQKVTSFLKGLREYVSPVLQSSAFLERGVLTPQEFVEAGDQLVYRCPTWSWEGGDPTKAKSYLPLNKQYLVTRKVPCHRRVTSFAKEYVEETEVEGGDADDGEGGWLATHVAGHDGAPGGGGEEELEMLGGPSSSGITSGSNEEAKGPLTDALLQEDHFVMKGKGAEGGEGDDEYADLANFEDPSIAEHDEATLPTLSYIKAEEPADALVATRTYDICITYDKYYQTPRAWLLGYDEDGRLLNPDAMFEDIMQDYANRTVTIESHPHTGVPQASIHPCQHANLMKNIVSNLCDGGNVPRTDQYLFIFLKFVQSVIPTVEYDYTIEVQGKTG